MLLRGFYSREVQSDFLNDNTEIVGASSLGFHFRMMIGNKKRILSISVIQAGLVVGGLYALLSLLISAFLLIFGIIVLVAGSASSDAAAAFGGGVGLLVMAVLLPVVYGALGFVAGVLVAAVYNLLSKMTGGLEVTVADVSFG